MNILNFNFQNVLISTKEIGHIKEGLERVKTLLPVSFNLSEQQREALPAISSDNRMFVHDALAIASSAPIYLPGYISISGMQKELLLFDQLEELSALSQALTEKLEDLKLLAGGEAFAGALTVFKLVEFSFNSGIQESAETYKKLQEQFKPPFINS
ncbi:MAG: hypothetical protein H7321_07540 [Bacteroidia bacterium]|nr:hypothetical protein [Bacteroidia bacterium]